MHLKLPEKWKNTFHRTKKMRAVAWFLLLVLCVGTLNGCRKEGDSASTAEEASTETAAGIDEITLLGMATDVLKEMTLEEKIGQLFIVCTDSLDFYAETKITEEMKANLKKYQPGGVILFSFNIDQPEQVQQFISDMQKEVKIPLFIGVDEEGGKVARIANNEKMGTTVFPSMQEIGVGGNPEDAYLVGTTIGQEISALGFNLDFAPVADVMSNEDNTEIGERSFGSDPALVSSMVKEVVKGLQENNVSATLKHFPGQGSSGNDTHKGFTDMPRYIDELRDTDFQPFYAGMKAGVDFIMISHVACSNITGNDLPASLSDIIVRDILRNEMEYENVIITDAMNMKSITKFYDADEAAVEAFLAGNDVILMPDDFELAMAGMKEAVEIGKISEEAIDESVLRILKTKIKRQIIPEDAPYFQ